MRRRPTYHPLWKGTMLRSIKRVDEALALPESAQQAIRQWLSENYEVGSVHPVLGTPCWNWLLSKFYTGYGVLNLKGTSSNIHRLAYVMSKGRVGQLHVLHACDNRCCINPGHLWLGTNADNVNDREAKGRNVNLPVGEEHWCAKITEEVVRQIRSEYIRGSSDHGIVALSAKFHISVAQVGKIVIRKMWKHVS